MQEALGGGLTAPHFQGHLHLLIPTRLLCTDRPHGPQWNGGAQAIGYST